MYYRYDDLLRQFTIISLQSGGRDERLRNAAVDQEEPGQFVSDEEEEGMIHIELNLRPDGLVRLDNVAVLSDLQGDPLLHLVQVKKHAGVNTGEVRVVFHKESRQPHVFQMVGEGHINIHFKLW